MIEGALVTGGKWIFMNIATYAFRKGMDKVFASKEDLEKELTIIIHRTIDEYTEQYPQPDIAGMYAFYKSQIVVEGLLQYRIMHPDYYNVEMLFDTFNQDSRVIPPTPLQIKAFYNIFTRKIEEHPKLKSIEIKSTFQEEVFVISSKLDNLSRKIEYILQSSNADLELQWKDRIDTYVATLKAFKPQTALDLLIAFENSFALGTKKPTEEFKATINYQKGICHQFLGNADESSKSYIIAYSLNQSIQSYKEKVALAYYRLSDKNNAKKLSEELLKENPFNPIACSILVLISDDIEVTINKTPPIVYKDTLFQSILWRNLSTNYQKILFLEEKGIIQKYDVFNIDKITVNNFEEAVYCSEVAITTFIRNYNYTGFLEFEFIDINLFNHIKLSLEKFIAAIKDTEIGNKYYLFNFYYLFSCYILHKKQDFVLQMRECVLKFDIKQYLEIHLCANALQIEKLYDFALDILNRCNSSTIEYYSLKAHIFLAKEDIEGYIKINLDCLYSITNIDNRILLGVLNILLSIKHFKYFNRLDILTFFENKTFEDENIESLIRINIAWFNDDIKDDEQIKLEHLECYYEDDVNIQYFIANIYFYATKYESAVKIYEKYVNTNTPPRVLYYYIMTLSNLNTKTNTLLSLLKKWRLNDFYNNENLLRYEISLRKLEYNWNEIIEVCNIGLNENSNHEYFLSEKILALDRLEKIDQDFDNLVNSYGNLKIQNNNNIVSVIDVFKRRNYVDIALDFLYNNCDQDINLHMLYLDICIVYSQKSLLNDKLKEFPLVEYDTYIKYTIDEKMNFIHVSEGNKSNIELINSLLGRKAGESFFIKSKYSNKESNITIHRIMDKYLFLHDSIYQKIHDNPMSEYPMESIDIKDLTFEGVNEMFSKMFGSQGDEQELHKNKLLKEYYEGKQSLFNIIISIYDCNYIGGYYNLINEYSGINILPIVLYKNVQSSKDSQYIIDFSSLPLLYQIEERHAVKYNEKFLISRHLVEILKRQIRIKEAEPVSEMSLTIKSDEVIPHFYPIENFKKNIEYYKSLLSWINNNCEECISTESLNVKRQLLGQENKTVEHHEQFVFDYFTDTLFIRQERNAILITDDRAYFQLRFPMGLYSVSTEFFIKEQLGLEHPSLIEFILNKYIGYSCTFNQLKEQFDLKLKGEDNKYSFCIDNLCLVILENVLLLIKYIITHSLLDEETKMSELEYLLSSYLKKCTTDSLVEAFCFTLNLQFYTLTETEANLLSNSLSNVLDKLDL